MTAQIFLESERDIRFVFDNQDAPHEWLAGSAMVKVMPSPSTLPS